MPSLKSPSLKSIAAIFCMIVLVAASAAVTAGVILWPQPTVHAKL